MSIEVIIAALGVMLVSLIGVVFVTRKAQHLLENRLPFLVSFSAGVFLVTAGAIGLEVFHVIPSFWGGVGLIVIGYILAWGMHALMPETHHHHDPDCRHDHGHKSGAKRLIVGDALHNIADGVIIVTAFAASPELGVLATVSIVIHEALQEISEFFVLRQAGYSTKQALLINFTVSSTILIGVGLGALALANSTLEGLLLGVSAGFFLHVVAHDLLPRRSKPATAEKFSKHVAVVVVGAVLMGLINLGLAGSHTHGDSHGHAHDEHAEHEEHEEHDDHQGGSWLDRFFHHHD